MHAAEEVHAITDALDLQIEAKKVHMNSTTGELSDLIHLVGCRQPCHNSHAICLHVWRCHSFSTWVETFVHAFLSYMFQKLLGTRPQLCIAVGTTACHLNHLSAS